MDTSTTSAAKHLADWRTARVAMARKEAEFAEAPRRDLIQEIDALRELAAAALHAFLREAQREKKARFRAQRAQRRTGAGQAM